MAGLLRVDIEVLGRMVQLLRGSEQVLNDALNAMKQDGHGDVGPKVLNDAADSFQRRWHYGVQQIGEQAKNVADGVSQCHDAYQETDRAFADALSKAQSAVDQAIVRFESK
ncbi:hypothetical protein IU494_09270 [Nocardia terpenica]|uniref:hypothetical protein n=1 Tax=Nocardia terpenica TaxID=455432 RepID=UPI000AA834AB|nr:hypothetical protein [Nocardia terpenica]MBF6060970.1 hypothetical protein [Nocardia terpenica]MBF6111396.1 hypothetical protein [Nocardia terpenica]MBF6118451.1 hypothetical protein [Nocardia terpenica]MBF6155773.1 hypothetical protein [Nocardia terpenica]